MPLTDAQIARFRADGFLVVEDVVPPERVAEMRQRIDAVTSPNGGDGCRAHGASA